MYNLRPKNIIVVGGTSGIGFSTAETLLHNGAESVTIASRNPNKLKIAKEKLENNKKVYTLEFDITNINSHRELIDNTRELTGAIPDGLVISSGVNFDGSNWKGFNVSESDWDNVMNTNLKGVFFLMRNFPNYLFSNKVKGNICIVSSRLRDS